MASTQNSVATLPGDYILTVRGPNGCTNTATATVTPDSQVPVITASGGTLNCTVQQLQISASATLGASIEWTGPGGFFSASPTPTVTNSGTYTIVAVNPNNGCSAEAQVTVNLDNIPPPVSVSGGTVSCNTPTISIGASSSSTNVASWVWSGPFGYSSNAQNPNDVNAPGQYLLTPLTEPDKALIEFAHDAVAGAGDDSVAQLHALMGAVHREMTFDTKATDVTATAAQAFMLRRGVCQDLTHVFIAAARRLGFPARYVSGHLARSDGAELDASHAWAEAKVPDLGWVGFDATNNLCPVETHLRVAVGLDYLGAAPIRGARYGGGSEVLDVKLKAADAVSQTQA